MQLEKMKPKRDALKKYENKIYVLVKKVFLNNKYIHVTKI